jgi:hypothetical protein
MQLEAGPEDVEIIVGPTDHAVLPLSFEETPGQAAQFNSYMGMGQN